MMARIIPAMDASAPYAHVEHARSCTRCLVLIPGLKPHVETPDAPVCLACHFRWIEISRAAEAS